MAVNILVDTTAGQASVDQLTGKIDSIALHAKAAGDKAKKSLSFGAFAKQQIKELESGLNALRQLTNSFSGLAQAEAKATKSSTGVVQSAQAVSTELIKQNKAIRETTDALNKKGKAAKAASAESIAAAKGEAEAVELVRKERKAMVLESVADEKAANRALKKERKAILLEVLAWEKENNIKIAKDRRAQILEAKAGYEADLRNYKAAWARKLTLAYQMNNAIDSGRLTTGVASSATRGASFATIIREQKALTAASNDATKSVAKLTRGINVGAQSTAALRGTLQGANLGLGIFTSSTVIAGGSAYGLARALTAVVSIGKDFEFSFNRASALLGTLEADADGAGAHLTLAGRAIEREVLNISQTTQFSAIQTSEAVRELAQAGLNSSQILSALRPILDTATVGVMEVGEAARITINIMEQFGLQAENIAHIGDVLAMAANISTTDIQKLSTSLSYAGAIAHQTGISLEETATAVALLAQAGLAGSKGGTSLRRIITILVQATDASSKAGKQFTKFGAEVKLASDGSLDLQGTFEELNRVLKDVSPIERQGFLYKTFGQYGMAGASALLEFSKAMDGTNTRWDEFANKINNAAGANRELATLINDNVQVAFQNLGGAMQAVSVTAFEVFGGRLKDQIREFTAYINENRTAIAEGLSSLISSLATIAEFLVRNGSFFTGLLKILLEYKIVGAIFRGIGGAVSKTSGFMQKYGSTAKEAAKETEGLIILSGKAEKQIASTGATAAKSAGKLATIAAAGRGLFTVLGGWTTVAIGLGIGAVEIVRHLKNVAEESDKTADTMRKGYTDTLTVLKGMSEITPETSEIVSENLEGKLKVIQDQIKILKSIPATSIVTEGKFRMELPDPQKAAQLAREIEGLNGQASLMSATLQVVHDISNKLYTNPSAKEFIEDIASMTAEVSKFGDEWIGLPEVMAPVNKALASFLSYANKSTIESQYALGPTIDPAELARRRAEETAKQAAEQAAADAAHAAALESAKQKQRELGKLLRDSLKDYGNMAGAIEEANRKLSLLKELQDAITAGSGKAAAIMQGLNVSQEEAQKAIAWQEQVVAMEAVSDVLSQLDPRFKDLADTMTQVGTGTQDYNTLLTVAMQTMSQIPGLSDTVRQKLEETLPGAIQSILDGTERLGKEMSKFITDTSTAWEGFNQVDGLTASVDKYSTVLAKAKPEQKESLKIAAAQKIVMQALGSEYAKTVNRASDFADIQAAINYLQEKGIEITGDWGAAAREAFKGTREGAVFEDIRKLNGELDALQEGGIPAMEEFDALWDATGGNIEGASDELKLFIKQRAGLQKVKDIAVQMQGVFEDLYSGLGGFLRDALNGAFRSSKDALDRLKDLFKKFLIDMILLAAKNKIVLYFTQGGGQNSTGFWANLARSVFGIPTGGSGSASGQAGSMNIPYLEGAGNFLGTVGSYGNAAGSAYNTYTSAQNGDWLGTIFSGYNTYNQGAALWGAAGFGGSATGFTGLAGSTGAPLAAGTYTAAAPWVASGSGTAPWVTGVSSSVTGVGGGSGAVTGAAGGGAGWAAILGWAALIVAAMMYDSKLYAEGWRATPDQIEEMRGRSFNGPISGFEGPLGGMMGGGDGRIAYTPEAALFYGYTPGQGIVLQTDQGLQDLGLSAEWASILSGSSVVTRAFGHQAPKIQSSATQFTFGPEGIGGTNIAHIKAKGGWFRSDKKWDEEVDLTDEQIASVSKFWEQLTKANEEFALHWGTALPKMVEAAFTTEYDKDGEVTKTISSVFGKEYEETFEEFAVRVQSEQLIAGLALTKFGDGLSAYMEQFRATAEGLQKATLFVSMIGEDMKEGVALFSEAKSIVEVATAVEGFQRSGEELADTYARLRQDTDNYKQLLTLVGTAVESTDLAFVKFAESIETAAGGLDKANDLYKAFFGNFYTQLEQDIIARNKYKDEVEKSFQELGLSTDLSLSEFRKLFEEALPNLSPEQIVQWMQAGNALAELLKLGDPAVSFMNQIHSSMAELAGGTAKNYTAAFAAIDEQLEANIHTAKLLGLTLSDLADIERLAAMQRREAMAELRGDISSLISRLFGGGAAEDAANAQNDYFNSATAHTNELSQLELQRYQAAQNAIGQIDELLNQLQTGDLSTNDYSGRLDASRSQFEEILAAAMSGDADAMAQLTQYASGYLQQAQSAYGNNTTYAGIEQYVEEMLRQARAYFETIRDPGNGTVGSGGSGSIGTPTNPATVALDALNRHELARELASYIGQLALATEEDVYELMSSLGVNIRDLATSFGINLADITAETIPMLGDLAFLLGVPVLDMLTRLGVSSEAISSAFNLDLSTINDTVIAQLTDLAGQLGTDFFSLISFLGIPLSSVAEAFHIDLTNLGGTTLQGLIDLGTAIGLSTLDVITAFGIDMAALMGANGVDLSTLDANNFTNFTNFATSIGTDIISLWTFLGKDIKDLGALLKGAFEVGLAAIPGISDEVVEGLDPYLQALSDADTPEEIKQAMQDIRDYINTLPEDQAALLAPIFTSVFGPDSLMQDISDGIDDSNDIQELLVDNTGEIVTNTSGLLEQGNGTLEHLRNIRAKSESSNSYLKQIAEGLDKSTPVSDKSTPSIPTDVEEMLTDMGGSLAGAMEAAVAQTESMENMHAGASTEAAQATAKTVEQLNAQIAMLNEKVAVLTEVTATKLDTLNSHSKKTATETKKTRKVQQMKGMSGKVKK